ncbi:MAG: hypothetical protein MRY57_03265 [Candidatus Pacebacteria bacterium]|nr:hypothetical protein [Candidatus Paceibacterota bacterium]
MLIKKERLSGAPETIIINYQKKPEYYAVVSIMLIMIAVVCILISYQEEYLCK